MTRLLTVSAAIALSLGLAAPFALADEPKKGGTLVMAIQSTPRHLNPAVQSGTATGRPGSQLFAAPLRYDEGWNPQPYLAEILVGVRRRTRRDAESRQGREVPRRQADHLGGRRVLRRDGARQITRSSPCSPRSKEVQTPDPHTAILKLSEPHPALMLAMSSQLLSIIPKHIYGDGQDPKAHPRNSENVVGSGPFKLVEFKRTSTSFSNASTTFSSRIALPRQDRHAHHQGRLGAHHRARQR